MNLLYVSAATTATQDLGGAFSVERWLYAARMTLLGMVMVFSVLGLLWGILTLFKLLMMGKTAKPKAKPASPEPSGVILSQPKQTQKTVAATDDEALIAVLTAAIAAYRSEENENGDMPSDFRVVSFRRVTNGRAWNARH